MGFSMVHDDVSIIDDPHKGLLVAGNAPTHKAESRRNAFSIEKLYKFIGLAI